MYAKREHTSSEILKMSHKLHIGRETGYNS